MKTCSFFHCKHCRSNYFNQVIYGLFVETLPTVAIKDRTKFLGGRK